MSRGEFRRFSYAGDEVGRIGESCEATTPFKDERNGSWNNQRARVERLRGIGGPFGNWTLHKKYFPHFVAIVDFVHPLSYIYNAAQVIAPDNPWSFYLKASTDCWQGRVADLLERLRAWQTQNPTATNESLPDHDPRVIVQTAVTYLTNNQKRMDYPAYRKEGLPVSTSMIESLIKEVNFRVKGTETFWNRPEGSEAILQVRAAALCDDDRLSSWILKRRDSYFYRRSTDSSRSLATAS